MGSASLGVTDRYHDVGDMPNELPVFPLRGAILLPRATLTLNVFEPRYLALVDYALGRDHLIGEEALVHPRTAGAAEPLAEQPTDVCESAKAAVPGVSHFC